MTFDSKLPLFEVLVMSGCIWMEPYGGPGMLALLSLGIWAYDPWLFKRGPGLAWR